MPAQTPHKAAANVHPETWIGGALALITLVSGVIRYAISPQTPTDLLTGIIAVTSPLLTLVVLIAAIRSLRALFGRRGASFDATLERELDEWLERMKPLVSVKDATPGTPEGAIYEMLTEHDHLLKKGEDLSVMPHVEFLKMPTGFTEGKQIHMLFRESMFRRRAASFQEDPKVTTQKVAKDVAAALGQTFTDLVAVHAHPDAKVQDTVTLTLKRSLTTADDAHRLLHLINYATLLYLAVA